MSGRGQITPQATQPDRRSLWTPETGPENGFDASNQEQLVATGLARPGASGGPPDEDGFKPDNDPFAGKLGGTYTQGANSLGANVTTDLSVTDDEAKASLLQEYSAGLGLGSGLADDGKLDGKQQPLATLNGKLSGGLDGSQKGTIRKRTDGRYDVTASVDVATQVGGSVEAAAGIGASVEGAAGGKVESARTVICTEEQVTWARETYPTDALAAFHLVVANRGDLAELQVGESSTIAAELNVSGGVGGSAGIGAKFGGGTVQGRSLEVERTEAGLRLLVRNRQVYHNNAEFSVGTELKSGGSVDGSNSYEEDHFTEVVLDPEKDAALIQELEGMGMLGRCDRIEELPQATRWSVRADREQRGRKANLGSFGAGRSTDARYQQDGKGSVDGSYAQADDLTTLGIKTAQDGFAQNASADLDGMLLTRRNDDISIWLDTEAELDIFSPLDTLKDLAQVEDKDLTVSRRLSNGDLDELLAAASDAPHWEDCYPKAWGQPGPWVNLGVHLRSLRASPEDIRLPATKQALAAYVANGGDIRALDRVCQRQVIGHAEQWPASIELGQERLTELRSHLGAPTKDDLIEADRLRNEVAAAKDFTVPGAKVQLLDSLVDVREKLSARLGELDPASAEDLAYEQRHVEIHAGLQRCSDFAAREPEMWKDGLGSDPDRRSKELEVFYERWAEAVNTLRGAYRALEIPPGSWAVTEKFKSGVDGTAYQPCTGRLLEYTTKHAVDEETLTRRLHGMARS